MQYLLLFHGYSGCSYRPQFYVYTYMACLVIYWTIKLFYTICVQNV
jgi:hypothetical protein